MMTADPNETNSSKVSLHEETQSSINSNEKDSIHFSK